MRWPLRYQIMLPMAAVMLLTVLAVGGVGALLAVRGAKARIDAQIAEVANIIAATNFPLTTPVLRQMRALSGAKLVLLDAADKPVASSDTENESSTIAIGLRDEPGSALQTEYFHSTVPVPARGGREPGTLHILYPQQEYRRAWQRAVYPSLVFVAIALPVMLAIALAAGARIAARVVRLRGQVDRIASGDFQQLELPSGDDEVRSLAASVNRMSAMLASYEQEVRRTERMRTLAHLGGGIAHQLRNSATGCAMAVDLHADECPLGEVSESLAVAKRQLNLMEEYIQRFLQLGKSGDLRDDTSIDLAALVDDLLPLVRPSARHAGVALDRSRDTGLHFVSGNAERLGQLVINLLLNAVEAAAEGQARFGTEASVRVNVQRIDDRVVLRVSDTGPGPAEAVQQTLFEPFVTQKPDGVGLGLSVAREIVEQHVGSLTWNRAGGMTSFVVELPSMDHRAQEQVRVESADCR